MAYVIVTSETTFNSNNVFNMHNEHFWTEENHHVRTVNNFQYYFKINVWAATLGNQLLDFYIFSDNLNYHEFLCTRLLDMPDNIPPLASTRSLWFIEDGASPHVSRQCWQWLNEKGRGIRRSLITRIKTPGSRLGQIEMPFIN